jgi:transposase
VESHERDFLCLARRGAMVGVARGLSRKRQTVYTYFRNWRRDGTWVKIHDSLRECTRIEAERQALKAIRVLLGD